MTIKIGPYERVLVFLIVIVAFIIGIIRVGGISFLSKEKKLKVVATKSYGLKPGSKVKMKDIEIGKVEKVILDEKNRVIIFFRIKKEFKDKVKKDSVATIVMPPLLGTPELHITCGSPLARDIPENSRIPLKEPEGDLVSTLQEKINPLLVKLDSAVGNLNILTEEILRGRGTIGKIFMNDELYTEFLTFAKNSNLVLENLQKISGNIAKASERLPEITTEVNSSLENVQEITSSAKKIVTKIERGEGTVGKLVTDDSLHKKTKEILTSTSGILKKIENINISPGMEAGYYGKQDVAVSKISAKISGKDNTSLKIGGAFLGYKDRGTKTRPEVLFTKEIPSKKISLKAGILEGEVGGGVEYFLNKKMELSLEGRKTSRKNTYDSNLDDFILRGWLGVKIKDYLKLKVGINNIADKPAGSLGISIEK